MSNKDPDLERLFKQIEMKPRDLLGPVHIRFLVHCFSEVNEREEASDLAESRRAMEINVIRLMNCVYSVRFLREMEVPEGAFLRFLQGSNPDQQLSALAEIMKRSQMSDGLSRQIWNIFQSDGPLHNRHQAAAIIGRFPNFSSNERLTAMLDPDDHVFHQVTESLTECHLCEAILSAAVDSLPRFGGLYYVQKFFARTELPQPIVHRLIIRYQQTSSETDKSLILGALGFQGSLNIASIYSLFIQAFDDPEDAVRLIALQTFIVKRCDLSVYDCQKLLSKLPLESAWANKVAIVEILKDQITTSNESLAHLWPAFETEDSYTHNNAFTILRDSGHWCANELSMRFDCSSHKDEWAISVTRCTLSSSLFLPDAILNHCIGILERYGFEGASSVDGGLLRQALNALAECPTLPTHIVRLVWQILNQEAADVQWASAVLRRQKALPDDILRDMSSRLEEQAYSENYFPVLAALADQCVLSDSMLESAVLELLRHQNGNSLDGLIVLPHVKNHPQAIKQMAPLLLSTEMLVADTTANCMYRYADLENILPCLGAQHWSKIFQNLLFKSYGGIHIICYIEGQSLHVTLPERSWRVSIEKPEQLQKLQAALGLNDIDQAERFAEVIREEDLQD